MENQSNSQQQQQSHLAFVVPVDPPQILATKKPQHLDSRFGPITPNGESNRSRQSSEEALVIVDHRRQRFLENRKSKLSFRQQHVRHVVVTQKEKQVQNQEVKSSNLANSLNVADKNRIRFLTSREKACAGHIAHVRKVAEAHYRRMAERSAHIQHQLTQKHDLVAKRRQKLLSIPRSRLLDNVLFSDEDIVDVESARFEAALAIQQWWRRFKFSPLIGEFIKLKLTIKSAKKAKFAFLMRKMQTKQVMAATSHLLKQIKKARPSDARDLPAWKAPTRIFLTSYMIIAHPKEIMPVFGTQEEALQATCLTLLEKFEEWMNGYTTSQSNAFLMSLIEAIDNFFEEFDAWKSQDTEALIEGLITHWVNLERLWLTVRHHPDVETNWRPKIESQQKDIYLKLEKLGDAAMDRLKQVQEDLIKETQEAEHAANAAATAAATAAMSKMGSDSDDSYAVSDSDDESGPQEGMRPIYSVSGSSHREAGFVTSAQRHPTFNMNAANRQDSVNHSRTTSGTKAQSTHSTVASPEMTQEPVDISNIAEAFGNQKMTNEYLAHELILNPDFKLNPRELNPLEEQIQNIAKKAVFDAAREEFAKGEYKKFAFSFIMDIRENLLSMLSEKNRVAIEIQEVLDMALIEQQLDHKAFDIKQNIYFVISKMLQLCAPVRDREIRDIAQIEDVATQFQRILETLDNMKLDLANFRLQSLKPILKEQSVEYEQMKFEKALENKSVVLDKTKTWLAAHADQMRQVAAQRNPENIQHPENRVRFEDIFYEAFLALLTAKRTTKEDTCPETLQLDMHRLSEYQHELKLLSKLSSLLLMLKNHFPEFRDEQQLKKVKDTLMILLRDSETTSHHVTAQLMSFVQNKRRVSLIGQLTSLSSPTSPTSGEDEETKKLKKVVRSMVKKTWSKKDPVFLLLHRRMMSTIKTQMVSGQFKKESLVGAGLGPIGNELESVSYKICLLASHNKRVCGKWYDEILRSL